MGRAMAEAETNAATVAATIVINAAMAIPITRDRTRLSTIDSARVKRTTPRTFAPLSTGTAT